jgi:hypothetical protein
MHFSGAVQDFTLYKQMAVSRTGRFVYGLKELKLSTIYADEMARGSVSAARDCAGSDEYCTPVRVISKRGEELPGNSV